MNLFLELLISVFGDICIFIYLGKIYGIICLIIISFRFLYSIGFIRSPKISKKIFMEGVAYLKDYQGPYNNPLPYKEALSLTETFNLKDFVIIALFYDIPGEVPEDKLRASIGIYKQKVLFSDPVPKEFEEYCKNNDYYSAELPKTSCLYSSWDYSNFFTMIIGIIKFTKKMKKNLQDVTFRKKNEINEEPKIEIELYISESKMEFYIPLANSDKFFVYKKEDKQKIQ